MNFSAARPLLNTYEDILNISSSEQEGEMFKYNATKEMGFKGGGGGGPLVPAGQPRPYLDNLWPNFAKWP